MAAIPERLSLFKRSGVYYVLYYSHGRRRWKSTGVSTRPEAFKKLTEFRELLRKRELHVSLSKFVDDFLSFAGATFRPGTVALYRHTLRRFQAIAGELSLPEITAEHFDKYRVARLKGSTELKKNPRPRSVVSVNVELGTLKAAFNTARRWGLVTQSPFIECSLCPEPEQSAPFFSPQDFDKLVTAIRERWLREVVVFAVLTGMRRGEILNLQWSQVNTVKRLVTIESSPTFKTKGGRRRVIPLNETAAYVLEGRRTLSASPYVFTFGDRQIPEDWLTHKFKARVRNLGLDGRLHFHSLRHTFASWLAQDGVSLFAIQKLLGHSSANVTQIYSHLQPDQMHDTVNRLAITLN
jgi:integrase